MVKQFGLVARAANVGGGKLQDDFKNAFAEKFDKAKSTKRDDKVYKVSTP
jgi:hypothetical protein